jgi:hypothetical protein
MNPDGDRDGASGSPMCDSGEEAARAAIDAQHDMILRLRDQGTISDQVLHLIEQELDHEQSRLEET